MVKKTKTVSVGLSAISLTKTSVDAAAIPNAKEGSTF